MHTFTPEKKKITGITLKPEVVKRENVQLRSQKYVLYLLTFLLIQSFAFGQTKLIENKIDPVFRYIMASGKSKTTEVVLPALAKKLMTTKGSASFNEVAEERYECIVYTKNAKALRDSGFMLGSTLPTFATAWATLDQIAKLSAMQAVDFIRAPKFLHKLNDITVGASGAALLHQGRLNNTTYTGKGVLVAIFDTGIDWKHLDFRNPDDTTKSRIIRMWDQTLTAGTGEAAPSGFNYGVEYTQAQINNEIDGTPANFVREKDNDGHGTHVAGTAVGNGAALASRKYAGMAPDADIIIIKGGEGSFSTSRVIDALTYLKGVSTTLGEPVVLNLSIGSIEGPHDGTIAEEVAIDNFSTAAGRAVAVAAGNDGGTNKHNRLILTANNTGSVSLNVPAGTSGTDVFSYRIYANNNGNVSATVTVPGGASVTATAGQTTSKSVLSGGFTIFLTNGIDVDDNNRYVDVDIERNGTNTSSPEGTWTLSITNNTASTLTLDGWLYDINENFSGTELVDGDNNYLVSSPGNAASAITVGSYVGRNAWATAFGAGYSYKEARQDDISGFSSPGPRRDNVLKPEITSDGQGVISALSSGVSSPDSSVVIVEGLYQLEQGTSMATPGVAGATALLLQANTSATASQLKNLITSNASKDALTEASGATPNAIWGYGKLDVFKAASALFNCGPADRKTYKYDASTIASEEKGIQLSTTRIGVRFTPDISGKLGGVFYETSGAATNMVIEVRSSKSGLPDVLLGTLNVSASVLQKYSWNYIDVSNLNISVTSGTDYFIVLYRDPASTTAWTVRAENISIDNRSVISSNSGATWAAYGTYDFKIRSVAYTNKQLAGTIATVNSFATRNINSSNQFVNNNCELIAQVVPNGLNPVAGNITAKVWLEGSVPHAAGSPYVQRHYEISPSTGTTATARVTLYFTQAEFTAFNNDPGSTLDLPVSATDAAGKANLRVGKFPGSSSDNSGLPATYSGTPAIIDPADGDIVWNAEASRWEVSFDVTGFSGFIVQTNATALPIIVEYFKGNTQGSVNNLNWKVNCTNTSATFVIERSNNGRDFSSIGTLTATQIRCISPFSFIDQLPLQGDNYYRIKIIENTGTVTYTGNILLQNDVQLITSLYPTIVAKGANITVHLSQLKGTLYVSDAVGRQVAVKVLSNGVQSVDVGLQNSGVYFYSIRDGKTTLSTGKIIVE